MCEPAGQIGETQQLETQREVRVSGDVEYGGF